MSFLGNLINPSSIGRGLGTSTGRMIGNRFGGQEGADQGGEIGGHLGAGLGSLMKGENAADVAKQSFAPISPLIGGQLGQYVGGQFGPRGAEIGKQFGNQFGIGASSLMYGKDPYQTARQTALGMLPGVASLLAGPGAPQAPQGSTGMLPVAKPATGYAHGGYAQGGYDEPQYAMGGYAPDVNPMDVYRRMAAARTMRPAPFQESYAYGGASRPNLREMVEMAYPAHNAMY